jgi:predicted nucleotidyltransferase
MDIENLLKSLNGHDVRYVIIGATAFPVHGYSRATLDIDIFIEPENKNINKLLEAISKMKGEDSNLQFSAKLTQYLKIIFLSKILHISFFLTIINQLDNRTQLSKGGVWTI